MSLSSGSTLSVSYAADLMALLLLGPRAAVVVAVAGAWMQCTFSVKRSYPLYRTVFSMAGEAITMVGHRRAYSALGGVAGVLDVSAIAKPLVGAIAHLLLRQHEPDRRRHCVVVGAHLVAGLARRIPLERAEFHGRGQRRRAGGGGRPARRTLDGAAAASRRSISPIGPTSSSSAASTISGATSPRRSGCIRKRSRRCGRR